MWMHPTTYEVTLREGTMCKAVGLDVSYHGAHAHVVIRNGKEDETFWAQRLAFLRANPNS
jgi:hypothetical protein